MRNKRRILAIVLTFVMAFASLSSVRPVFADPVLIGAVTDVSVAMTFDDMYGNPINDLTGLSITVFSDEEMTDERKSEVTVNGGTATLVTGVPEYASEFYYVVSLPGYNTMEGSCLTEAMSHSVTLIPITVGDIPVSDANNVPISNSDITVKKGGQSIGFERIDGVISGSSLMQSGCIVGQEIEVAVKVPGYHGSSISFTLTDGGMDATFALIKKEQADIVAEDVDVVYGEASAAVSSLYEILDHTSLEDVEGASSVTIVENDGAVAIDNGNISYVKPGSAKLKVDFPETNMYSAASGKFNVTVSAKNLGNITADQFKIDKATATKKYDKSKKFTLTGTIDNEGLVGEDKITFTAEVETDSADVGSYDAPIKHLSFTDNGCYTYECNWKDMTLPVVIEPLPVTLSVEDLSVGYRSDAWRNLRFKMLPSGKTANDIVFTNDSLTDAIKQEFDNVDFAGILDVTIKDGFYYVGTTDEAITVSFVNEKDTMKEGNFLFSIANKGAVKVSEELTENDVALWERVIPEVVKNAVIRNGKIYFAPNGEVNFNVTPADDDDYNKVGIYVSGSASNKLTGENLKDSTNGKFYLYNDPQTTNRTDANGFMFGAQDNNVPAGTLVLDKDAPTVTIDNSAVTLVEENATWAAVPAHVGKTGIILSGTLADASSGLKEARFSMVTLTAQDLSGAIDLTKLQEVTWENINDFSVIIPDEDGIYAVLVEAKDNVNNDAVYVSDIFVVDTQNPRITISGINESIVYSEDIEYSLTIADPVTASGLESLKVEVYADGSLLNGSEALSLQDFQGENSYLIPRVALDQKVNAGTKDTGTSVNVAGTRVQINAKVAKDLNSDDIRIVFTLKDKAGNETVEERRVRIDATAPEIELAFDNNDVKNEKYFNATRTLTAAINERDFDPAKLNFNVSVDGVEHTYTLAELQEGDVKDITLLSVTENQETITYHTDEHLTVVKIRFGKENEDHDYTVSVNMEDKAGNKGEGTWAEGTEAGSEFTVDMAAPELGVMFVENEEEVAVGSSEEGRTYSNETMDVRLSVNERMFENGNMVVTLIQKDVDGNALNVYEQTSLEDVEDAATWTQNEALFTKNMASFDKDANYTLSFDYTDKAGNKVSAGPYMFTVDKTNPTAKLTVDGKDFNELSENAAFHMFYKDKIRASIEFSDAVSPIKSVQYAIYHPAVASRGEFDIPHTVQQMNALEWETYTEAFEMKPNEQDIIYTKVEDASGNITYINTKDGVVLDDEKPEIEITSEPGDKIQSGNAAIRFTVTDPEKGGTYAGLKNVAFDVYCDGKLTQEGTLNAALDDETSRVKSVDRQIVVEAAKNNSNDIMVTLYAEDYSGNKTQKSTRVYIDMTEPEITVSYDKNSPKNEKYFNEERDMTLVIQERNFVEEKVELPISIDGVEKTYSIAELEAGAAKGVTLKKVSDSQEDKSQSALTDERKIQYLLTFGADGKTDSDYVVDVKAEDAGGNQNKEPDFGNSNPARSFTIDEIAPKIDVEYTSAGSTVRPTTDKSNPLYSQKPIVARVIVEERNHSGNNLGAAVEGTDFNGNPAGDYHVQTTEWASAGNVHTCTMPTFENDANYSLKADYEDLAGNKADYDIHYFTVDGTAPTGEVTVTAGDENGTYSDLSSAVRFWFYSNSPIRVTRSAEDATSGVASIDYYRYVPGVESRGTFNALSASDLAGVSWSTWEDTMSLSPNQQVIVYARIIDKAGNITYINTKDGIVADNTAPAEPVIEITTPATAAGFYNGDVPFGISVEEQTNGGTYAGLRTVTYEVLNNGTVTQSGNYNSALADRTGRVKSISRNETVNAAENNSNHVVIRVTATDYAGNTASAEKEIKIDITKPAIEIIYDRNDGLEGRYYNGVRTATVSVTERNFDPAQCNITITSVDGKRARLGSWNLASNMGESDNAVSTCLVYFEDDDDYTITADVTDQAGNSTSLGRTDSFTIDRTLPVISLTFDKNEPKNERYYNETRTAIITVTEHNFDASRFNEAVSASLDGADFTPPALSEWTNNGDVHTARIIFAKDGDYRIQLQATDRAGNAAQSVSSELFTIDKTEPVVKIKDIKNKQAYNDDVSPIVEFTDLNHGEGKAIITLTGARHEAVVLEGTFEEISKGGRILLKDFLEGAGEDDVYVLKAEFTDLAGNTTTKDITFSINRNGSNYTFDEETQSVLEKYYWNEGHDLVIFETNVNELTNKGISIGREGSVKALEEGKDYSVEVIDEDGWKVYKYTVFASNFDEEGVYEVLINSVDEAGNSQDNKLKEQPISVVIDKTKPSCVITGIENNGRYRAASMDYVVNVSDNMAFGVVRVYVDGELVREFTAEEIQEMNGVLPMSIADSGDFQSITVKGIDAAGNEYETDAVRVLVTPNAWTQFYRNTGLFAGTVGGISLALVGLILFLILKKKKKDDEEKEGGHTTDDLKKQ